MNKNKKAIIVAAETKLNYDLFNQKDYFFIGVERGALDLIQKKIPMTLAIGDFDKVTKEEKKLITKHVSNVVDFPKEKDYLDGELAVKKAQELNASQIFFVANPTKRYDKNLSIIDLVLKYNIIFFNEDSIIFLLKKGHNVLDFGQYQDKNYISFFARKLTNLSIKNMKYDVENLKLDVYENTCISNSFLPNLNAEIITDQELICILSK